jgi:hypothetical protein
MSQCYLYMLSPLSCVFSLHSYKKTSHICFSPFSYDDDNDDERWTVNHTPFSFFLLVGLYLFVVQRTMEIGIIMTDFIFFSCE